jgi:PhzF family phenazine biosynthesis protein
MMRRPFHLVDVFGAAPLEGNPLAVVAEAEGLSTERMLQVTRWFNLSETTFLLPPGDSADYRVRIFTLADELPFAGHPTLGTCHVWASTAVGPKDRITQECGAGLVELRRESGIIWFQAPPLIRDGPVDEETEARVGEILGINGGEIVATRWVDNGPGWVGVLLDDADAVLELEPEFARDTGLDIGVVGFHPAGAETAYEVRAFFTDHNGRRVEDPVTGSLNASVAEWMLDEGRVNPPYRVSQGSRVGRRGIVHIDRDQEGIWVGGATQTIAQGFVEV